MNFVLTASNWLNMFGLTNWVDRFTKRIKREQLVRQTANELEKLSDRELRDIGIHRGMIRSIAMECYYDNRA